MKWNKFTAKTEQNILVLNLFDISLIFVGIAASVAVAGCNYIKNRDFKETFYCVSSLKVNNNIFVLRDLKRSVEYSLSVDGN